MTLAAISHYLPSAYTVKPTTFKPLHVGEHNENAFIVVQGFTENQEKYRYPETVKQKRPDYDAYFLSYHSGAHVKFPYPGFDDLAEHLETKVMPPSEGAKYKSFVFLGDSAGGLIVLRALLNSPELTARTKAVLLFASPIGGVKTADTAWWQQAITPLRSFHKQGTQLMDHSQFIHDLNRDLNAQWGNGNHPRILFARGDADEVVPRRSSIEPMKKFAEIEEVPNGFDHAAFWYPEHLEGITARKMLEAADTAVSTRPASLAAPQTEPMTERALE
jgi:pimeloyl-ACP methyl ester carboxylesterase